MSRSALRQSTGLALEPDDRVVGSAAAEVGDEHRRVPIEVGGEIEGGREPVVHVMDSGKPMG